jgi:hypothetical protein
MWCEISLSPTASAFRIGNSMLSSSMVRSSPTGMLRGTLWEGVALRRIRTGADPDATPRAIALPAAWEDEAAAALAALAPGEAPISLPRMAEAW